MKNATELQAKFNLTESESFMLSEIVSWYKFEDNICFDCQIKHLTNNSIGLLGSLTKKGLIYDSYKGTDLESEGFNFFPVESVLDFCELQHY